MKECAVLIFARSLMSACKGRFQDERKELCRSRRMISVRSNFFLLAYFFCRNSEKKEAMTSWILSDLVTLD